MDSSRSFWTIYRPWKGKAQGRHALNLKAAESGKLGTTNWHGGPMCDER